jgi:hypothetical protein
MITESPLIHRFQRRMTIGTSPSAAFVAAQMAKSYHNFNTPLSAVKDERPSLARALSHGGGSLDKENQVRVPLLVEHCSVAPLFSWHIDCSAWLCLRFQY